MNLMTESLWGDEAFSALAVQKDLLSMLTVVMKDTAPPLFYLVGYAWVRLFGSSEVALRSLTLLLMLGAAVFAGLIVYRISKEKITGLIAGGLTFLSPFLLTFAFEWRMYALLTFTVTASTYFFISKKWSWYIIFALASLYTHHFAIFTILAQGIWFMISEFSWRKPKMWLRQLSPFLWIIFGYSFWLYPMYLQIQRVRGSGFWLSEPKPDDLLYLLWRFSTGGVIIWWQPIAGVLAAMLLLTKDWRRVYKDWLGLLLVFSAPIFFSYFLSKVVTPIFYDRYLLSAAVGSSVLLMAGTRKQFVWVGLILLLLYGYASWNVFTRPTKRPFREFAAFVKTEIKPGDFLVNWNGGAHHIWETKYYGIPAPIYTPNGPLPLYVGTAQMTAEDTIDKLPDRPRIGLIASEDPKEILLPGYKMTFVKQFGELRFVWWTKTK
ncbi:hypothetical protein A3A84_00930 [Candidatus Collierbacteria bacterium RIFCSPLOWO2_01_FULL_50_23]|uniref:Glycosyltransferase RgtA/B/C/D-like domain-containing protein n=2 Tax=Candidatus Collieribacteriota TaxID=1752725 RepID=A0A1F5EUJ6_9BACT|nr:MAG: hypothetical protein A2703_01330 [Candidatus Collierbacteria bacterium RIFCSPHIGHO2_01_FULL_50_25]OGD74725.1 MAG: hypothetical protein A3A84_00930 [Candidatus Collierbacteria bacterium RIFCSPLOWO2_01_FULL_50_23]